jgi:hypothetical protein
VCAFSGFTVFSFYTEIDGWKEEKRKERKGKLTKPCEQMPFSFLFN